MAANNLNYKHGHINFIRQKRHHFRLHRHVHSPHSGARLLWIRYIGYVLFIDYFWPGAARLHQLLLARRHATTSTTSGQAPPQSIKS
jgi:hypothetical protein